MMFVYAFVLLVFLLLAAIIYGWIKMILFQIEFEREGNEIYDNRT